MTHRNGHGLCGTLRRVLERLLKAAATRTGCFYWAFPPTLMCQTHRDQEKHNEERVR